MSTPVGGRGLGKSSLPARVRIERYEQAWRLLGVAGDVARFDEVVRISARRPAVHGWVLAHPLQAASLANAWPAMLAAHDWLDWNRGSGRYLRQIDAPGVDTKFIEQHRAILAEMLGVPKKPAEFLHDLGFADKPRLIRVRLDPALLGLPDSISEVTLRLDELRPADLQASSVLIVENETTFLSVPVPERGVALWGRGYDAGSSASLDWLAAIAERGDVRYWGDIDTHGFAILNRVRSHLPTVRSVLMDRETLLAHEPRWGHEPTPTNAALEHLTEAETALYTDLVTDRFGSAVRLEQERIDWAWATRLLQEK